MGVRLREPLDLAGGLGPALAVGRSRVRRGWRVEDVGCSALLQRLGGALDSIALPAWIGEAHTAL
jgi:hypothetical protein